MQIKEVFEKVWSFFISKKFKSLRKGVFTIFLVSIFVVVITLLLWNSRVISDEFSIESFVIAGNKVYQKDNTLEGMTSFRLVTNYPSRATLIIENVRGEDIRTFEVSKFDVEHLINITFTKSEILRPFTISGIVVDKTGHELRIPVKEFLPGQTKVQISIS